jgi:hypothetical protein
MPRMIRHVLLALAISTAFFGCTMYPEKKHVSAWSSATGGEHFDRLLWEDVKTKRFIDIEPHLAPALVATFPGGVRDRAAFLDYLKALQLTDYSISDVSSVPAGGDIVVTYTITLHGSRAGQPLPDSPMTVMTVWQQVKKGYIAISHSETPRSAP